MKWIILAVVVLTVPGMAHAMQYYTFEGTVSSDIESSTIDFQDQLFPVVFAIDFDGVGSSVDSNGLKTVHTDRTQTSSVVTTTIDNFYAEVVSTNFR